MWKHRSKGRPCRITLQSRVLTLSIALKLDAEEVKESKLCHNVFNNVHGPSQNNHSGLPLILDLKWNPTFMRT